MDRESFLDTVKTQYADEIHEAYIECEHEDGRNIDIVKLNGLLTKMMKNAKVDGLPAKDFEDLVRSTLPDVANQLDFIKPMKSAA